MTEQTNRTEANLNALSATLNKALGAFRETEVVVRQRADRIFWAVIALGIGLLVSIFIGLNVKSVADTNADRIEQNEEARLERTVGSCVNDNVRTNQIREALYQSAAKAITGNSPQADPERLATFLGAYRQEINNQLPFRDCSPSAVENYLRNPPPDPAT